jgi:Phage tail tube protein
MEANQTRLTWALAAAGSVLGAAIPSPRMRTAKHKGFGVRRKTQTTQSEALRADRMNDDPIQDGFTVDGQVMFEVAYPNDNSPESDMYQSLMCAYWANQPFRDNDGTADSVITDVSATVITVTSTGAALPFVAGQLVQTTGFGVAGNNGLLKCTTGSATVPAFVGAGLAVEPVPPAAARMKVVGFEGATGDITATATGLASTTLNFTTLGLVVGQSVKIGDLADATTFAFLVALGAVARRGAAARITAIAANALTLDNLPAGWAVDAGAAKTIRVFVGDTIKNGTLTIGGNFEEGYLDMTPVNYTLYEGCMASQGEFSFPKKGVSSANFTMFGLRAATSATSVDAIPDPAITSSPISANVGMTRLSENGVCLAAPNYGEALTINVNNNITPIEGLTCGEDFGPLGVVKGSFDVTVSMPTYFGDASLMTKLENGTATNIFSRLVKNNQALVFSLPRITFTEGALDESKKNAVLMLPLTATASKDTLTNAHLIIDRFEFVR